MTLQYADSCWSKVLGGICAYESPPLLRLTLDKFSGMSLYTKLVTNVLGLVQYQQRVSRAVQRLWVIEDTKKK